MEFQHFYHAVLTGLSGIVVPLEGRVLFLPADSQCIHEVNAAQLLITGEASTSMQHFLQAELARRLEQTGGAA